MNLPRSDRITGLQLSEDCRWLLSSSMDGTLRVWDVPAALCLQVRLFWGLGGPQQAGYALWICLAHARHTAERSLASGDLQFLTRVPSQTFCRSCGWGRP